MPIELRILTGSRGGYRERFDKRTIALGRHANSDLRFDPNGDLDVSVRHAEIVEDSGGAYRLRDLGSTNGTFVNGHRLTRERTLHDGDVLSLGTDGPKVEVHVVAAAAENVVRQSMTEQRIKAAVLRETASLRRILVMVIVLALIVAGVAYWARKGGTAEESRGKSTVEKAR